MVSDDDITEAEAKTIAELFASQIAALDNAPDEDKIRTILFGRDTWHFLISHAKDKADADRIETMVNAHEDLMTLLTTCACIFADYGNSKDERRAGRILKRIVAEVKRGKLNLLAGYAKHQQELLGGEDD